MNNVPIKVLVVDDEPVIRLNLAVYFEDQGYQVRAVADGETALNVLANDPADVGIIDVRLPGMDGDELIVRSHKLCPDMRFLIYTGSPAYYLPARLRGIGIRTDQVFAKPIPDMAVMADAVVRLLAEKGA